MKQDFSEEVVGKSLKYLSNEEMNSLYDDFNADAETRASPTIATPAIKAATASSYPCLGIGTLTGIGGAASSANDCLG